jgi:osmotically inducible lipoprotein OsmB
MALAFATFIALSSAGAQERTLSGAAIGGGTGAIIAGPPGAVVGAVIGGLVGGPTRGPRKRWCWTDTRGRFCRWR